MTRTASIRSLCRRPSRCPSITSSPSAHCAHRLLRTFSHTQVTAYTHIEKHGVTTHTHTRAHTLSHTLAQRTQCTTHRLTLWGRLGLADADEYAMYVPSENAWLREESCLLSAFLSRPVRSKNESLRRMLMYNLLAATRGAAPAALDVPALGGHGQGPHRGVVRRSRPAPHVRTGASLLRAPFASFSVSGAQGTLSWCHLKVCGHECLAFSASPFLCSCRAFSDEHFLSWSLN